MLRVGRWDGGCEPVKDTPQGYSGAFKSVFTRMAHQLIPMMIYHNIVDEPCRSEEKREKDARAESVINPSNYLLFFFYLAHCFHGMRSVNNGRTLSNAPGMKSEASSGVMPNAIFLFISPKRVEITFRLISNAACPFTSIWHLEAWIVVKTQPWYKALWNQINDVSILQYILLICIIYGPWNVSDLKWKPKLAQKDVQRGVKRETILS